MRLIKRIIVGLLCLCMLFSMQISGITAFADNTDAHYRMNLEVRENIISHYVVDYKAYEAQGAVKLHYRYNQASENQKPLWTEGDVAFAALQDDVYVLTVPQSAAQIAEPTEITVYDENNAEIDSITFSALAYCEQVIQMTDAELADYTVHGASLRQLCMALVTYGKAAQDVFSTYITTGIEHDYAEELSLDNASYTAASTKTNSDAVSFGTASYLCTAAAQMRFYYTAATEPEEEPVLTGPEGTTIWKGHANNKNGTRRPFVQVENIKPVDFDEQLNVSYGGATLAMSVLDYAGKVIAGNASEASVKFAKSLIVYHREAEAYFTEHAFGDWTLTTEPTCTEDGVETRTCAHCDAAETQSVPALGHDWSDWEETVHPNCTHGGLLERYCTRCDASESETLPPSGVHSYYAEEEIPATCTAYGQIKYSCIYCGNSYYETDENKPPTDHTPAEAVHEYVVEETCTESGSYDEVVYCSVCGEELSRESVTVPATGHTWSEWTVLTPATDASCTADGVTAVETRSCYNCDATETRGGEPVPAFGHNYALVNVAEAGCVTVGMKVYECTNCGDRYTETIPALGHLFGEWEQTVAPTCTEDGAETRTCLRCGEESDPISVPALGHDYEATVIAPTCTEQGYTTYTCSRCGDSYTADETAALGHDMGEWTVVTPAAIGQEGERKRTCSRCDYYESEAIPALTANIEVKLPHVDSYLYRAGNANNIAMGSLFRVINEDEAVDSAAVTVTIENVAGNANGTFTANTSDWAAGTVKLSGTGVVKLTVKQSGNAVDTLYLEVVAGTNYAEGATLGNVTSNNAVLLGDVNCKKITVNNGKTLYGNGFSVTDARTDFSGAGNSYITMNGGGSIDNAKLLGKVYESLITSGQENQYYAPGVWITGDANIYNSYVSETKNAVQIDAGTVYFENSTFAGGALANIDIGGGDVTLKNCITKTTDRGGLKGLGIRAKTANCKIHLLGTFTQNNWLKKSDLPSMFSGVLSSVYTDTNYAYSNSGSTYVNMGVFFFTETGSITQTQATEAIDDKTENTYGYVQKTSAGITATVYTAKASMGSAAALSPAAYDETVNGQYPIPAANTFDYTNKNYIAKTEGSNRYCYYDSTTKQVMISFDKENSSSAFSWDPMILTATKNGNTLSYTVSMNGTDYTNKNISFAENGDYTVTYTYTDPYNYGKDGTPFSKTYTKTVNINVVAVEPDDVTYYASFQYDGAAGNYAAKKVIGTDSKTYVMPDVSATSTTIGKTTVAGQTVYYPIVTVNPTSSNGNTAYSSGKGYYFAPVFSELHIIDYNQETGAQQYEYSKSTSTWPHGKSATTGPDTAYFTCASGEKTWSATSPYGRSMNSQYYKYGKNNLGVCYTSTEIEKDNAASTHLVQYHYVSNDGTTYYYYIQYKFSAMTYSSCVTDGTLVTMGDGTQKPIEDVKVGDMVMTWSMWNGCYEAQPVVMHWYHGTDEWRVLTLHFSDGTAVRTIKEHGFFDADKNTYAYITEDNVGDYIGDRFIKQNADGTNSEVVLTDYDISHEMVGSYSIQTAFNENFIVEGMLSMTGEDYRGRFEYFDIGDGMQYDAEKMQADIDRYGLYSYEDFSDYLTPEQFAMFNGQYFKVLVGKGVLTYEDILDIINTNLSE